MNKVKKVLLPALLATAVAGVTGAVVSATPVKASANDGQIYASVSLTDGIVFNYFTPRTDDNAPTAVFNGAVDSMDTSVVGLPTTYYGTDMWVFQYDKVTPQLLGEKFTISIGGTPVLTDYSVEDYCLGLNAKTASELKCTQNEYDKTAVLVKDLLFYGEAAKAYTNQSYEIPADVVYGTVFAGATDNAQMGTITSANKQNFIKNATVEFDSQPAIKFGFILKAPEGVKAFVGEQELTLVKGEGNNYTAVYSGIMATKFDEQVTVTLKEGNTVVHTVTYGINDYVARVQDDSNSDMVTLAKALYNYGASADVVYAIPDYTPNGDGTHASSNYQEKTAKTRLEEYVAGVNSLDVQLSVKKDWGSLGGSTVHGMTSDGTYLYGVASNWASTSRPAAIFRYDPATNELTASAINAFGVNGDNCGVTYYNGNIYVFTHDSKVFYLPADFAAGATPVEATIENAMPTFKVTAEGEAYVPYTVYYSQENAMFAVRDRNNNLYLYNESDTTTAVAGPIAVGCSHLTGTEDYVFASKVATGGKLTMVAYDWAGNKIKDIVMGVPTDLSGYTNTGSMNTQGVSFVGEKFYFAYAQWISGTQTKIFEIVDIGEYCVHTGIGDKMGDLAVADTSTTLDMQVSKAEGWKSFGLTYNHDIVSDGRYVYGISGSGDNGARTLQLYRYDTATGAYLQGPKTAEKVSTEQQANITYYDGKVIVYYGTTGKLMATDAETFGAGSTFTEYTGISFTKDGSALNAWDFEQNKRTGQYVVNAGGTIYIFERDKTSYKSIGSALRFVSTENYIYTITKADGTITPILKVYDWSGNALGTVVVPNTATSMGYDGTSCNVQGLAFANGALYFSMARWAGSGYGVLMKAQIIDAMGTPCYYCDSIAPEYGNFTIVTTPTLTSGGLAQNEMGAQVTLPALSLDDYDIEGGSGSYVFTYKANENVSFTASVPIMKIDDVTYDVFNLYETDTMTSTYDGTKFVFTLNGNTTLNKIANITNLTVSGNGVLTVNSAVTFGDSGSFVVNSGVTVNINGIEGDANILLRAKDITIDEGATVNTVKNNATGDGIYIVKSLTIGGTLSLRYTNATQPGVTGIIFKSSDSLCKMEATANIVVDNVQYAFWAWNPLAVTVIMPNGFTAVNNVPTSADGNTKLINITNSSSPVGGVTYINNAEITLNGVAYEVDEVSANFANMSATCVNYTKWTLTLSGDTTVDSLAGVSTLTINGTGTLTVNSNISITNITIENGATLKVNVTAKDAVKVKNLVINGNITVAYATTTDATAINLLGGGSATLSETGRVTISNVSYGFTCWNAGGATLTVPTGCTLVNGVITMADGTALETYTNCNNKHNPVYPDGQDRGLCIRTEDGAFLQGATDPITDETKPAA